VHQRKVIRKAVAAAIVAGETAADERVYPTQKLLYAMRNLPAIAVYSLTEKSTLDNTAPRELTRIASVAIESIVEAGENVDDAMDDLAEQIEAAMDTDPYFSGSCFQSHLSETEMTSEPDGDRQIGVMVMTYEISYRTDAYVSPAVCDDFKRAEAVYDLEGQQAPLDRQSDLITVQSP